MKGTSKDKFTESQVNMNLCWSILYVIPFLSLGILFYESYQQYDNYLTLPDRGVTSYLLFWGGGLVAAYLPCRKNFALAEVGNVGNWPSDPITLKYFLR